MTRNRIFLTYLLVFLGIYVVIWDERISAFFQVVTYLFHYYIACVCSQGLWVRKKLKIKVKNLKVKVKKLKIKVKKTQGLSKKAQSQRKKLKIEGKS